MSTKTSKNKCQQLSAKLFFLFQNQKFKQFKLSKIKFPKSNVKNLNCPKSKSVQNEYVIKLNHSKLNIIKLNPIEISIIQQIIMQLNTI